MCIRDRLHRRVITSTGAFAWRIAVVWSMRFRISRSILKEHRWNQKICLDRLDRPYVNNIFWNYRGQPLRNKKVIRVPRTRSMTPKNRKFRTKQFEFSVNAKYRNIWSDLPFASTWVSEKHRTSPAAGYKWLEEWLHRRVISSAGAIARRIGLVRSMRFRTSRSIFETQHDEIRRSV